MIPKILVAMDGSDSSVRAYEHACFLAKKCDAPLIIVNIIDTFERISVQGGTAVTIHAQNKKKDRCDHISQDSTQKTTIRCSYSNSHIATLSGDFSQELKFFKDSEKGR